MVTITRAREVVYTYDMAHIASLSQVYEAALDDARGDYPDVPDVDLEYEMAIVVAIDHPDQHEAEQWLRGTLGFVPEGFKTITSHRAGR